MTASEMTTLLGLRMEDVGESNFTATMKYGALNIAQRTISNFLHEAYLTELEYKDMVSVSGNGGMVSLTGDGSFGTTTNKSSKKVIRNSIRNVQFVIGGVYKYAIHIPFKDVKKLENTYLGADEDNPVFWVFGNNVTFRPVSGTTTLVLYYLREPDSIDASNDCDLNSSLHDIVVDLAEAELWRRDNNVNRYKTARESGMASMQMLNDRYSIEAPTGVNK